MKLFREIGKKLIQKDAPADIEIEIDIEDDWGAAMADLYSNELSSSEEQWEVDTDEKGNSIAHFIK